MKNLLTPLLCAYSTLLWWPAHSQAQDAGLRQCRGVVDAAARLACYDALPIAPSATALPPAPPPSAKPAAVPSAGPATPLTTATSAQTAAATSLTPSTAPTAADGAALEAQFGLLSPTEKVKEIVSRFEGLFEGWRSGERIALANGQVWQIADGSSAVYSLRNPKVTIRRGSLGQFVLDVEGAGKSATVRRIQ